MARERGSGGNAAGPGAAAPEAPGRGPGDGGAGERGGAKRRVLFLCVRNSARSQMAAALFARHAPEGWESISAGTEPAERVEPNAIAALAEVGIDISGVRPQRFEPSMLDGCSRVVAMGCLEGACLARLPGAEDWGLHDPTGTPLAEYRRLRDRIEERVLELAARLQRRR